MFRSRHASLLVIASVAAVCLVPAPAFAIKQFADEFKAVYVKDGTPLAAAVETAKCNVCHAGKSKKERNAYGEALAERLDKETDKKDVEKIRKVLDEVAKLPSKVSGKTFGELIADGKLPAE
jgi:hypothetical protein